MTSWVMLSGVSSLALVGWIAAALLLGHREDLGLVVLVGGLLAGLAAAVVVSTDAWSAASDLRNRRPGVGPVGRGADPGGGGGDVGGC